MDVQKKRQSKATRNMRRSHHARTGLQLHTCQRCQQPVPGHTACPNCGTYQGRDVIDVLHKLSKKERREKEKMQKNSK